MATPFPRRDEQILIIDSILFYLFVCLLSCQTSVNLAARLNLPTFATKTKSQTGTFPHKLNILHKNILYISPASNSIPHYLSFLT